MLIVAVIAICWCSAACAAPLRACAGQTLISLYPGTSVTLDVAETVCAQRLGLGASSQLRTSEELAAALSLLEAGKVGAAENVSTFT